ncbi:MAG: V-type ATPase subunit [Oscillospiraceae bacterium]|jgi:V/A-type H+-transporting ATPase subunit C|nr:V-type ATPase subunit [Oscillospiraceae bacterium]
MPNTAIVGKAHAMYGRRLKPSDWEALISCSSVAEAAAYLKSNTAYHTVLSSLSERSTHRGVLEDLLHQRLMQEVLRLSRYDFDIGEHTANYLIGQIEIDRILHAVIRINSHEDAEATEPSAYLNSHTRFDQRAVDRAVTYDQLLEALQNTHYAKLMQPFRTPDGGMKDYAGLETALLTDLYTRLYQVIDHETHGKERQALHEMFDNEIDLRNYARIFRLKSYYHVTDAQVRACLLPFGTIPKDKMEQMITAVTPSLVTSVMNSTRIGKRALQMPYDLPGNLSKQIRYWQSWKNMLYSAESSVVMLSYIFLMETELSALVNLIEGLRYGVPKAEIKRLLSPYKFG